MDNEEPKTVRKLRWHSIFFKDDWCLITLGIPIFFWAIWLSHVVFGLEISSRDYRYSEPNDKPTSEGFLAMVMTASTILLPIAIYRYRRTHAVLIHGVETSFRITSAGIGLRGLRDIEIEYSVNKKLFRKRLSVSMHQAEGNFRLIVNPKKPTHIAIEDLK